NGHRLSDALTCQNAAKPECDQEHEVLKVSLMRLTSSPRPSPASRPSRLSRSLPSGSALRPQTGSPEAMNREVLDLRSSNEQDNYTPFRRCLHLADDRRKSLRDGRSPSKNGDQHSAAPGTRFA